MLGYFPYQCTQQVASGCFVYANDSSNMSGMKFFSSHSAVGVLPRSKSASHSFISFSTHVITKVHAHIILVSCYYAISVAGNSGGINTRVVSHLQSFLHLYTTWPHLLN